jgi:gamma-glutamyl-gamma-aminobutyrate hydrolase PuuD
MNTKPIIGIAPNYSYEKKEYTLSEDYVLAIEKAGGCPIVLLPHQALPPFLDGLLLTGGGDIDPLLFRAARLTPSVMPVKCASARLHWKRICPCSASAAACRS